jgi:predicted nucleic acid-binding protein
MGSLGMNHPPRVMLDANLLIGAFLASGASRQVMEWAREGRLRLVLCPYVIAEARRMISLAFPRRLAEFDTMLAGTPHELASDPAPEVVAAHRGLVEDPADVPVAVAAISVEVDCLLSSDRHLVADDDSTRELRQHVTTMRPARFVAEYTSGEGGYPATTGPDPPCPSSLRTRYS